MKTLDQQISLLNPYNGPLTQQEQQELWSLAQDALHVRQNARYWVKAWAAMCSFCFLAAVMLLGITLHHQQVRDKALEQANARVLEVVDELVFIKKQQAK